MEDEEETGTEMSKTREQKKESREGEEEKGNRERIQEMEERGKGGNEIGKRR